jgi:phosphatidyl-myo-inositol dimannoside synthase
MSTRFDVSVLAPPDKGSIEWPADAFKLIRSASLVPGFASGLDGFWASSDLNELATGSLLAKLGALPSLLCFFCRAFVMTPKADIICSHWLVPSGLVAAIASRILGKPHIAVEHSGALHLLAKSRLGRRAARFIIDGSDRVVVVSNDLKVKLLSLYSDAGEKIDVVSMGIIAESAFAISQSLACKSVSPWASLVHDSAIEARRGAHVGTPVQVNPDHTRTVLFIGRLIEIKGVDLLLTAMKSMPDVRLVVAGDGDKRSDLEVLARELSVSVKFVGPAGAGQREALLTACDVVVVPSRVLTNGRTEGTPVVCLEAMAAGRVVIASRTGGLRDIILDGENGLLFEPGDHRALREKLVLALSDEDLRRRIATNARQTARAYDWSRIGERFSNIIESSLEENGQPCSSRIQAGDLCR